MLAALPIAHAAAGYLVLRTACRGSTCRASLGDDQPAVAWRLIALFMFIGNLPDFDFLIGFVAGRPGLVHRGVSHTIGAAVAFGVFAGGVARSRWRAPFLPAALAFAAAYGSHLLLDWLTVDSRPPEGGQFLWPFSDAYYIAPIRIFGEIHVDGVTRTGFLGSVLAWPTVVALGREAALTVGAVLLWKVVAVGRGHRRGTGAEDVH